MYTSELVLLICLGAEALVVGSFLVMVLVSAIKNAKKEHKPTVTESQENSQKEAAEKKVSTTENPYLAAYYKALADQDKDAMVKALIDCKAHCSGANSWCLTEMFCPDCPISGALPVQSARYGM